jgi:RHS repeat-associated protein
MFGNAAWIDHRARPIRRRFVPGGRCGTSMISSGGDQDSPHFASLERDAESRTEHAQFRNYASAQGRWLAPDPYAGSYDPTNLQSMNRDAYVSNNPVSFVDPTGLDYGFNCGDGCVGVVGTTGIDPFEGPTRTTSG